MGFERSLQEKLGEHDPTDVDELILDELFHDITQLTTDHKQTLEKYQNLAHLSLNGFGLESLKNIPKLNSLQVLELRQNKLNGNDLNSLINLYPELYKIKLGENPITDLNKLDVLKNISTLRKLELQGCDLTNNESYRDELFRRLPKVEIIDRMNNEGDEVDTTVYEEESEEGEDSLEEGEDSFEEGDEEEDFEEFDGEEDEEDFEEGEGDEDDDFEDEEESEDLNRKKGRN